MGVYVYVHIQSHFLLLFKRLPPCWAFAVLWSFPYFFFSFFCFFSSFLFFYNFNFLNILYFSTCIPLCFLLFFSTCTKSLIYINLLHLAPFNFAYLFFLSFPLNIFVSFIFIALFPTWHLALVLFSSLCFS